MPGRTARHVVTLHDLFFLKHPEMTEAEVRRDYAPLVRDHVKRAHGVICVSEYTAREAQLLLDVPREKIAVIPNGVDPAYRASVTDAEVAEVLARRQLPRGAILYVGSQEKRKNLVNLAMAYLGLSRRRRPLPPLLMVGPGPEWTQGGSVFGSQITAIGYLETREIRALMAASALLVLPSLEEGFGLPVAEAMAAGLPVVCSRGSALEEVAGGAATLVDPLDAGSIAAGIEKVLENPALAEAQRQRGLEWSQRFDWDAAARRPSTSTGESWPGDHRRRRPRAPGASDGHREIPPEPAFGAGPKATARTGSSPTSTGPFPTTPSSTARRS